MTDIFCDGAGDGLPEAVHTEPFQQRLKNIGIRQTDLAAAIGITPTNLSEGLRGRWRSGIPGYLIAIVVALEMMPEGDRSAWLARVQAERAKFDDLR